jgi:predicted nucleic acid-binding protein
MSGEFLDTNVVIYSLSQEEQKQNKAIELLSRKPVVSVQVLSESANTMRRKLGFDVVAIRAVVHRISQACSNVQPVTLETLNTGLNITERYGFSHYDSLIIAAALQADCDTLYSEDLQHGQTIEGRLIIRNPFL